MKFKALILAGAMAAAGLASVSAAQAAVWNFSYTAPGITASGSFVTAGAALSPEPILSVTGVRNGVAITGLVPLGQDPDFTYDNLFTVASPNFSDGGFLFSLANGGFNTNVYFFEGAYSEVFVNAAGNAVETPISWSVTAVPEPATVLSMLAGLGMLGFFMRRRSAAR